MAPLKEEEILYMEQEKSIKIPITYKNFLMNLSNGLDIFNGTLTFYGYRKHYKRDESLLFQPFALEITNVYERPEFSKDNYFYIGSYDWDGSKLYIDTDTNHVHLCKRENSTSLYEWNSFEEMLSSEIDRIFSLFTDDGRQIDENQSTLPI